MNEYANSYDYLGPTSDDAVNVFVDGPGDTTVRPVSPERRVQLEALKAKIAFWEAYRKEQEAKEQCDKSNGAK